MNLMQMLKCCLNPRVLLGLAVIGAGLWVFAPKIAVAALPVLVALICPLSMVLMLWGMSRMTSGQTAHGSVNHPANSNLASGAPCCDPKTDQEYQLAQLRTQETSIRQQIAVLE